MHSTVSKQFPLSGILSFGNSQKSHDANKQANTVVRERHASNFWRKIREGRVQCERLHQRDVKTKIVCSQLRHFLANNFTQTTYNSQIIIFVDGFEIQTASPRSLTLVRLLTSTCSSTFLTCYSSVEIDSGPERSSPSTLSRPALNCLYHL